MKLSYRLGNPGVGGRTKIKLIWGFAVDSSGSGYGHVAGACEYGSYPSDFERCKMSLRFERLSAPCGLLIPSVTDVICVTLELTIPVLEYLITASHMTPTSWQPVRRSLLSPLRFGGVTLIPRLSVWVTPGAPLLCCKTARESTDINRETFSVFRYDWFWHILAKARATYAACCLFANLGTV